MLLMRDDDGQLMTCSREEVSLDPAAQEMIPAPPRILVWVVAAVWVLSKRHFIPTCVTTSSSSALAIVTTWPSS
jgi:hypothetical protein